MNHSRGIPGYGATYRTVASPTRASSPASIGMGPGCAGSHRGSASHRPSAYPVLRSSVYGPDGPWASRLAANVALSFATRRSPAERNRGKSAKVTCWCRWRRHEETHRVPVATLFHLHGCGREQLARLLEEEFLPLHAGTSQTVPWASNLWPVTRKGSCPSSHAQNGSVTSGSGRSLMSCPG